MLIRYTFCLALVSFLLVALPCTGAIAQDNRIESLMTEHLVNCDEVVLNCERLIPAYYATGKTDSMLMVLRYWDQNCPQSGSVKSTIMLYNILTNQKIDSSMDGIDLGLWESWWHGLNGDVFPAWSDSSRQRIHQAARDYDTFIKSLASQALSHTTPHSLEYIVARHYAGNKDSTLYDLQDPIFSGTPIRKQYDSFVEPIINGTYTYAGVGGTYWIPASSGNTVFGSRPELDGVVGITGPMLDCWFLVGFRPGSSANEYSFTLNDVPLKSTMFSGTTYEGAVGYKFMARPAYELLVYTGANAETYYPGKGGGNTSEDGVISWHLLAGLGYSWRFRSYSDSPVLNCRVSYNPCMYHRAMKDSNVEGPFGNTVSLRLSLVFELNHGDRRERLEKLSYRGLD